MFCVNCFLFIYDPSPLLMSMWAYIFRLFRYMRSSHLKMFYNGFLLIDWLLG
jgi:hypothetical protein